MAVISATNQQDAERYQNEILVRVSRTFALTIPQLPAELYRVVANAYLLCRIADTVEDESALDAKQKSYFHRLLVKVIEGRVAPHTFSEALGPLLVTDAIAAEKELVAHTATVISITHSFNPRQREALTRCVTVMCRGMPKFESSGSIHGLRTLRSLDQYCYYVAGVVGEMLTAFFCEYSPALAHKYDTMATLGVSFGQGLQMTNILKDFWEDHDRGVCWLPRDVFHEAGVDLSKVCRDYYQPGFGVAYQRLVSLAHAHLRNAFEYTLMIPASEAGVRRFCLIALSLAVRTLQSIYGNPTFTSGEDVKISHGAVRKTMIMTQLFSSSNRVLRYWFACLCRDLPIEPLADDWSPAAFDRSKGASTQR